MLEILFSSRVRAKVLTSLFLSPGIEWNAWELAQSLKESYSAVWKELHKLEKIGILKSEARGNAKVYQVNPTCPIVPELRSITLKTEGLGDVIRENLKELKGVKQIYIYGSFASGDVDERSDIDLMIIGEVELDFLSPLIAKSEKQLNRPINYVVFTETEWEEKLTRGEPFTTNVAHSPKIMLMGDEHDL